MRLSCTGRLVSSYHEMYMHRKVCIRLLWELYARESLHKAIKGVICVREFA